MPFDIITRLRESSPENRVAIIQETYDKNRQYFQKKHPTLHDFLEKTKCPYRIDLTSIFFNIVHEQTNELAHPEAGLDAFAEMLGGWVHEAWQDIFNLEVVAPVGCENHLAVMRSFDLGMGTLFPERRQLFNCGRVNLKPLDGNRRFSPPVVFLGIFHGLHIAHYLHHSDVAGVLFVEPEPERFEVSCYFLDYEEIEKRFGVLHLHLGKDIGEEKLQNFISSHRVSTHKWLRVLPGYISNATSPIVDKLKVMIFASDITFPLDRHFVGLNNALKNIIENRKILSQRPKLSRNCKIAIVATGPSLDADIAWLKKNEDRMIIFAVHSAVRSLRKCDIIPDYQFSVETDLALDVFQKLNLYKDVPLICFYKAGEEVLSLTNELLLCGDKDNPNLIEFTCPLTNTQPSTANLAFSFACCCRPEAIYLLGCDFGYRSYGNHHAHMHIGMSRNKHAAKPTDKKQMLVSANFPENGPVLTESFFIQAQLAMEEAIKKECRQAIKVFNFADGAKINGAKAKKSALLKKIAPYKQKVKACQAIRAAFLPAEKGVNYQLYPLPGKDVFDGFKKVFLRELYLEEFSWQAFFRAIDTAIGTALSEMKQVKGRDFRMDIYVKVLYDILATWYLYIIFYDDKEDAERVYKEGYSLLTEIISSLEWPAELDEIYDNQF